MWLWEPRAFCPFSQKPIQLCTIVTKHWHTLTRPLHKLYTLIWGPIDCLALEVIFAERLEFAKCWHCCTIWKGSVSNFLPLDLACACVASWMHKRQSIFYHRWRSRRLVHLERNLENVTMKYMVTLKDRLWPDIWSEDTLFIRLEWSVRKSLNFGLKGFRLVHSPAPTPSWWWLVINVIFGFHPGRAVLLETNQSVS